MRYIKVENEKNLVRDKNTQAILNVDRSAIARHELRIEQMKKQRKQLDEINTLRSEIAELKSLIQQIISK